jgi:type I restriction-modification system DNA methylase subunit
VLAGPRRPRAHWPTIPRIIARHGDFQIIYCRQDDPFLRRSTQREVIQRLLPTNPYALFLFSDDDASDWHLINVKYDDDTPTRRVFRRFEIGPDERQGDRLRTISEQLTEVALADHELGDLKDKPIEIQRRYDKAFDVEAVTRRFYQEYRQVFTQVEQSVAQYFTDVDQQRMFTQRLFNRLMFLRFIEKKGWLRFPDHDGTNYLDELWRRYRQARSSRDADNFYSDRLKLLFFNALDTPHGSQEQLGYIGELVGEVPYLNGGLFEQDEHDHRSDIEVPDTSIDLILNRLFDRFNFTVTESTPLDVEVAVDPEMLGKVFEELITGRHESGSYYTPKPIVSFMCQEALKGYLETELSSEHPQAIANFVEQQEPEGLSDPEGVLEALKRVRACDPACGSGAYLLGLLHELFELRHSLFRAGKADAPTAYRRKLEIIQQNLYGVDIDPFAVNIARLRLWLSLAVDYEGEKPEPLPNLDYKIEVGDSILGPEPPAADRTSMRAGVINDLVRLKAEFMTLHSGQRRHYRDEIEEKIHQLSLWTYGGSVPKGFDWAGEFAEVFYENGQRRGFDIVLANPPYVRQELIKDIKPHLKDVYGSLYAGTADLYVYFYLRSFQLLRPGGVLVFISSNKWFRAGYGKKLRAWIAENADVLSITDFGDLPVFDSATAYPMVFIARSGRTESETRYTEVESLDAPYPNVRALVEQQGKMLPPTAIDGEGWLLADADITTTIAVMRRFEATLGDLVDQRVYRGLVTGLNKAFVIDTATRTELIESDPKSADIIKPFFLGRDVRRWSVDYNDRWLIYSPWELDIHEYPAVKAHLSQWKTELGARPECREGRFNWWCLSRYGSNFIEEFSKPKIVYQEIATYQAFAMDLSGSLANNKVYGIITNDHSLLAILNSKIVWKYYSLVCSKLSGGALAMQRPAVTGLPVPSIVGSDRAVLSDLAKRCIVGRQQGDDILCYEEEIEAYVARLYGIASE